MQPNETGPAEGPAAEPPGSTVAPEAPPIPAPANTAPKVLAGTSAAGLWGLALLAMAGAAAVAWLGGEATLDYYKPSEEAASASYAFERLNREQAEANARNGAIAFGLLGGALGLGLGLAGGLARRCPGAGLAAGLVGLLLGGAVGAGPAFAVIPYQYAHRNDDPSGTDLTQPLMIHSALWVGLGAVAGASLALGLRGPRPLPLIQGLFAGLIGAAIGTLAYELIGAILFPQDWTVYPISHSWPTRLLARGCVALFATVAAVLALTPRAESRAPAPANPPAPA